MNEAEEECPYDQARIRADSVYTDENCLLPSKPFVGITRSFVGLVVLPFWLRYGAQQLPSWWQLPSVVGANQGPNNGRK